MPFCFYHMTLKQLLNLGNPIQENLNIILPMEVRKIYFYFSRMRRNALCLFTWGDWRSWWRTSSSSSSSFSFLEEAREGLGEARGMWWVCLSWSSITWRLVCIAAIWVQMSLTFWEMLCRALGATSTSSSTLVWRLVLLTFYWCWVLARVALLVLMVLEWT